MKKLNIFLAALCSLATGMAFAQVPANDNIASATTLTLGSAASVTNVSATIETGEAALLPAGLTCPTWCDNNGVTNTVWYKFVAPASGAVNIVVACSASALDSQVALFRKTDANAASVANLSYINSNDDATNCTTYQSGFTQSCLTAGQTYWLMVDGWNGYTGTASLTVSSTTGGTPPALTLSVINLPPTCQGGADGAAGAFPQTGSSPYNYIWSNGGTTQIISGLAAGTYNVTVTDQCGQVATGTTTLSDGIAPGAFTYAVTATAPNCSGAADGSLDVLTSGGAEPYAFSWSNGAVGEHVGGLAAGTYSFTVQDACGTVNTGSAVVPASVTVNAGADDLGNTCNAGLTGTATVNGLGNNIVTYAVDRALGGMVQCSASGTTGNNHFWRRYKRSEFPAMGTTATTIKGIRQGFALAVHDPALPSASIVCKIYSIPSAFSFPPTTNLTLVAADTIQITDADSTYLTFPITAVIPGTRDFVVEIGQLDGLDVEQVSHSVYFGGNTSIQNNNKIYLTSADCGITTPTLVSALGTGFSDYSIVQDVFLQDSAPTYSWSPATYLSATNILNPSLTASNIPATTYTLSVTDACGNVATDAVTVNCGVCGVPTGLVATNIVLPNGTATWNPVTNATKYQLEGGRMIGGVPGAGRQVTINGGGTSFVYGNVQAGKTYYWRVRAYCSYGWGAWSSTVYTTAPAAFSVSQIEAAMSRQGDEILLMEEFGMQVLGNPVSGNEVRAIVYGQVGDYVATLTDINGREISRANWNVNQMSQTHAINFATKPAAGVYILSVKGQNDIVTERIVVQ